MPDPIVPKLTIFISYVREDGMIAAALNNALQNAFGQDITVFVDRVSIQQGENILQAIKANLDKSDVLAIVSTGTERPSHDWAGFELGYFSARHSEPEPSRPLWGRIVTLAAPENQPRPTGGYLYIPMEVAPSLLSLSEEDFSERVSEVQDDDPLLQWFGDIHEVVYGQSIASRKAARDSYRENIHELKCRIFAEYKRRPKAVVRPQKQLLVRYLINTANAELIQDKITIAFNGGAASVFGIPEGRGDNAISWETFCELISAHQHGPFWALALMELLQSVAVRGIVDTNRMVVASQNEHQLFRLVLTTSTTFHNGWVESIIYLVDVYRRDDIGNPGTSRLLKGLQLICRFRFLFLEVQSEFHYLNIATLETQRLADRARKIVRELDILTADSLDADLDKPADWLPYLTVKQLEAITAAWMPLQLELTECCKAAINALDEHAKSEARQQLANLLKRLAREIRPHNADMLSALSAALERIAREETSEGGDGVEPRR